MSRNWELLGFFFLKVCFNIHLYFQTVCIKSFLMHIFTSLIIMSNDLLQICSFHTSMPIPVALSSSPSPPSHHCLPVLVSFIWWPCASPWPHLWSRSIEAERGWASTVWWFPLSLGLVSVCHEDAFHYLGVIIFQELIRLPYLAICWTWDEHFILLKIGGNNPLQYSLSST